MILPSSRSFPFARCLIAFGLLLSATARAGDQDWPQWRGPRANGVAPAGDPPTTWSETENVKWKVKLPGTGTSTPIVLGDLVFIHAAIPATQSAAVGEPQQGRNVTAFALQQDARPGGPGGRRGGGGRGGFGGGQAPTTKHQFVLLCLDRNSGKTLWQKTVREEVPHEGHHRDHGFASHSPLTDGSLVFAFFGSRGVHCFDTKGNPKWSKDLGRMETRNDFGEGSSPALHGDTLVVNWDHEGADFIVALDKNTGEERWRNPRDEITSWSTPLIVEHGGRAQVIVNATAKVRSYDLETGKQLWEIGGMTTNVIPTPVAAGDMVYVMSGFRGSALLAIQLGQTGDLSKTDAVKWTHNKGTPYVPSPLLYDNRLYFVGGNNAVLSCFDVTTGKPLYETQRVDDLEGVYASPVGAAGRVYLTGRNGVTAVLKNADTLEVLATNKLDDRIDASPAVAGNELFLRGHQYLYCIAKK